MRMNKLVNIFIGASEEEQEEAKARSAKKAEDDEDEKDTRHKSEDNEDDEEEKESRKGNKARRKSSEDEDDEKESRKSSRKTSEDEEEGAGDDDEKDCRKSRRKSSEEEDEDEKDKAALMAKNPRLYRAIRREGVLQERNRIKAIEEMAFAGHASMIADAKFGNPCSAEALAMRLVKAENKSRRSFGAAYEADTADVAGIPAAGISSGDSGGNEAAISAMVEGMKASGHKQIERR